VDDAHDVPSRITTGIAESMQLFQMETVDTSLLLQLATCRLLG
jgi:hypothetical protein